METVDTNSNVKELLLAYLRGRGVNTCLECACNLDLPPMFREFASAQDIIGWDNFVMGMISHKLLPIQSAHFHTAGESYRATGWAAGLIKQLLQVTHTQWIYRCMLVHGRNTGILISAHKADILKEIEHQISLGPDDLAEEDRFLLECNFTRSRPPQGRLKVIGCWGYRQPERRHAYAANEKRKHNVDHGNVRDRHKKIFSAIRNTAYEQLRYAEVEQFPSKINAWMRDALSPLFVLSHALTFHCLYEVSLVVPFPPLGLIHSSNTSPL